MSTTVFGIIGTGGMGRGIAEVAIAHGIDTILVKATPGNVADAHAAVAASLERAVTKGRMTPAERDGALTRLTVVQDLAALADADLVVESVREDLETKRVLLAALEAQVSPRTVIASNTSSLPLPQLASALMDPSRFLGIHFFSPVPAMKLVEIATLQSTSSDAVDRARLFTLQLDKTPVLVADSPGYIVNRLLLPFLLDAIRGLENGLASAESIDAALRLGCGHPVGPLALADAIGLDVVLAMSESLFAELDDPRFRAPLTLRRLCALGHLGKKSGAGIYRYDTKGGIVAAASPTLHPANH
jgi:3-hydroxybutyryl-CoA dehydrogenase